jgi:hypothetical protein
MKKKIFAGALCLSILASSFSGYRLYSSNNSNQIAKNLLSEDVEALSNTEAFPILPIVGVTCEVIGVLYICYQIYKDGNGKDNSPKYVYTFWDRNVKCMKQNGKWGVHNECKQKETTVPGHSSECRPGEATDCL